MSWCSVSKKCTASCWKELSSNSGSSKEIEKVRSLPFVNFLTRAVVIVESKPPLRYAPTGTSERKRICVASTRRSRSCAAYTFSWEGSTSSDDFSNCVSQYFRTATSAASTVIEWPGGSSWMFLKRVVGGTVHQ